MVALAGVGSYGTVFTQKSHAVPVVLGRGLAYRPVPESEYADKASLWTASAVVVIKLPIPGARGYSESPAVHG